MRIKDVGAGRWLAGFVHVGFAIGMLALNSSAIGAEKASSPSSPPTYSKDIAPILQKKCQGCHRRNQVAPFRLEKYEHARKRAADIATVVAEKRMPPWKPARGVGPRLQHE